MEIQFDHFTIRPIAKDDANNYFNFIINNKARIAEYFPKTIAAIKDVDSTILFIADRLGQWEKREFISFVICDRLTQNIIGAVFLKDFDWNVGKCELGFFIDQGYENKGLITKTVSLISDHCFRDLKLNKLFMRIAEDNIPSKRVAEKNGFLVEGKLREDFRTFDGRLIDLLYFGLLKAEHNTTIENNTATNSSD